MDNNDFDFGSFGNDNSSSDDLDFGFSGNSGFGNDNSFDSSGGFGDFGDSNSGASNNSSIPDDAFNGAFDTGNQQDFSDDANTGGGTNKMAIILIVIGVIALLIVILIGTKLSKSSKNTDEQMINTNTQQTQVTQQYQGGGDASSVISTTPNTQQTAPVQNTQQQTVVNTVVGEQFNWTEISNSENVTYNDYITLTFTVTEIKHYARAVDASGTLVTKTTLTGSLAGLPGTYSIDVPYSKGVILDTDPNLGVGCTFEVAVQLGDYNGKKVIGDITTYLQ